MTTPTNTTVRNRSSGFTLIELVIVVAIIGILASLATSAYQTYVVRAQVAEGINLAAAAKTLVAETYNVNGVAPADRETAGMDADPLSTRGTYVSSVDVANGQVTVVFGGPRAHPEILGRSLAFTPHETASSTIVWRCGFAPAPAGSELLTGGDPHVDPTVDRRYLPHSCRE